MSAFHPKLTLVGLADNVPPMTDEPPDPLEERALSLRRLTPHLVADVRLYETADGGKTIPARPGWGCPCMVSREKPLSGNDGWPVLDEPMHPGEQRVAVPFVFLSLEGAETIKRAGHFYLWEGCFVGEAQVVSD